jgi:lysophospholipase L1-like esterase
MPLRLSPSAGSGRGLYLPVGWDSNWRTKLAAAGSGKARVAVVGDSIAQGFYSSKLTAKGWVALMRATLQARYGDGGTGFHSSANTIPGLTTLGVAAAARTAYQNAGDLYTLTGAGWTAFGPTGGPGATSLYTSGAGDMASWTFRGTTVDIYFLQGAGAGEYDYRIDTGAWTRVVTYNATVNAAHKRTISGLAAGTHTVDVRQAVGAVYFTGIAAENATGVVVNKFARFGGTADLFANTDAYGPAGQFSGGLSYPGDLVIYALGINDANTSLDPFTFVQRVGAYVERVRGYGALGDASLLFVLPHGGTIGHTPHYLDYAARLRGVAEAYGAALIDFGALGRNSWDYWNTLGYWSDPAVPGAAGGDWIHPSDAGHQYMADQVLALIG